MWKYFFNLLFIVATCSVLAQQEPQVPQKQKADWRPYDIKIGINAIRTGNSIVSKGLSTHEAEVAVGLHKYILVGNFGAETNRFGETYDYENIGTYYRVGFERNFTKDKKSGNALSLGLRYARASFEDRLEYTSDVGFGEQVFVESNDNLQARWLEITFGLRGKLVSNLYTGFTMRWQFARSIKGEGQLKTFEIPGFGKTRRQNSTAFDYYFMWRIPFKR